MEKVEETEEGTARVLRRKLRGGQEVNVKQVVFPGGSKERKEGRTDWEECRNGYKCSEANSEAGKVWRM